MRFLQNRINVLMEKPMGINVEEAQAIASIARDSKAKFAVGFNYRHYPAIARAKQLLQEGAVGNAILVRTILGHGGRPGYEKEWKLSRAQCGGGVLFDPGVHLVDLGRFFLGELEPAQAHIATLHWSVDVEDIAVAIARNRQGAEFHLHTSLIEWENHFSVGIFGDAGYIKINGRMGNYGGQELVYGKKWAWLENGSQHERNVVEVFGNEDTSFSQQTKLVVEAIRTGRPVPENYDDGLRATELVEQLYRMATVKP
jgi:predicted dehydrogenase